MEKQLPKSPSGGRRKTTQFEINLLHVFRLRWPRIIFPPEQTLPPREAAPGQVEALGVSGIPSLRPRTLRRHT
jgi:hypothetical protein